MRIELLKEVDSTNDYIKKYLDGGEDVIVCAERQSGGKGTKGRSFLSKEGGVYLSALKFYKELSAGEAFKIMTHAAVAVCRTVEHFGVTPEIKWANDVLVQGRKICGILIENMLRENRVHASIVGIGLNVYNDLTGLNDIAVSLSEAAGARFSVERVQNILIENYQRESTMQDYLSYVKFLGREITVFEGEREFRATAQRILPDGRLEISESGFHRVLSAAEIKIRV